MRKRLIISFLALAGLLQCTSLNASPAALAPFVDDNTFVVIHVDVKGLDLEGAWKKVKDSLGSAELVNLMAPNLKMLTKVRDMFLQTGARELFITSNWAESRDASVMVIPIPQGLDKDDFEKKITALAKAGGLQVVIQGEAAMLGSASNLKSRENFQAAKRPDISKALEAAGTGPIRGAFFLPEALRKAIAENVPNLPRELGGASTEVITSGFVWGAASIDPKNRLEPKIILQAKNAQAAEDLAKLWKQILEAAILTHEVKNAIPQVAEMIDPLIPKAKGDQLILVIEEKTITSLVGPAVEKVRLAAARQQSINNLQQMALAMHAYHDVHKSFPPAFSEDAKGKKLLSWRVHILPFIDQENLFKQFKLDEPWDSDHNKKLIAQMPNIYRSPLARAGGEKTTYLVPVGPMTIFEGKKGIGIGGITDGTSNTILIVEADDPAAVVWTKPDDLPVNQKDPLAKLNRKGSPGFLIALADGSVRMLASTINPNTLWALFTRNGGELINPND